MKAHFWVWYAHIGTLYQTFIAPPGVITVRQYEYRNRRCYFIENHSIVIFVTILKPSDMRIVTLCEMALWVVEAGRTKKKSLHKRTLTHFNYTLLLPEMRSVHRLNSKRSRRYDEGSCNKCFWNNICTNIWYNWPTLFEWYLLKSFIESLKMLFIPLKS